MNESSWKDISLPIHSRMLRYPGDPAFRLEPAQQLEKGDPASVSVYHLGSHTGTHVDPPGHFLKGGGDLGSIPLERMLGRCHVVDVEGEWISAEQIRAVVPAGARIVLLRTWNSRQGLIRSAEFSWAYSALGLEGAKELVRAGVRTVGIDYLSIEKPSSELEKVKFPVHKELLRNDVAIIEGLDLTDVEPGEYELAFLPLAVRGGDGGPGRAILRRALPGMP